MISGDKAKMEVNVATNMGIKTSVQEFLLSILEHDTELLVMGVQWHSSLVGKICGNSTSLVNMDTFGNPMPNPLDAIEDKTEEDKILDDENLDVYPRWKRKKRIINVVLILIFQTKTRLSQ